MPRARYFENEGSKVRCMLCPHYCLIGGGETGRCGVRRVENGVLYSTNYGCIAAAHLDPVEKKPLYHYHPGSKILSLGTFGCNLHCSFCQNWNLARGKPGGEEKQASPSAVVAMLDRMGGREKVPGVAYTYNEPLVWYEFVFDTARHLQACGYHNVLVTNGYVNREPMLELLPFIDAMNIDLKAFSDSFYRRYCRGSLKEVLETIELAASHCHVEVTCLLIPTLNDSPSEQENLARRLGSISPDLVLHYSRYYPQYRLDLPPTPPETMLEAREIARKHLRYVYLGNIDIPGAADTRCPHCGNLLILRSGYRVRLSGLEGDSCVGCKNRVGVIPAG